MSNSDDLNSAVQNLVGESWGAWGWLTGMVQLSDRARAYKAEKLRKAVEAVEVYLACAGEAEPQSEFTVQEAGASTR